MPHRVSSPRADARATFNACIRTLYEDTRVPVREIARLAGVSERNIYALVRRLGCRPRGRLPVPVGKRTHARASAACRRAALRQRKLAAAARAELERRTSARRAQRQREADARAVLYVAQALRELARLDARNRAGTEGGARIAEANAADLDRRRRELARRITNLSRNEEAANEATAALPVGARIRLVSD